LDQVNVSIIGASGYSGTELYRHLARHPRVRVNGLFARSSAGSSFAEVAPLFRKRSALEVQQYSAELTESSDVVFIALPSGEAMHLAPELVARGKKVIDLSGDFRIKDIAQFNQFYGHEHAAPALIESAAYGLPEWNRSELAMAKIISNPGCYPTSVILPLAPLLREGVIASENIVINSLSGVSGAGRKAALELNFTEVNETVKAYRIGDHQHIPEIRQTLGAITSISPSFTFLPHLIPITRGIYTTITVPLIDKAADIAAIFEQYYGNEPFVRFHPTAIPEIKNVAHTNFIDIGYREINGGETLVVMSAIDNLIKGAAGQAIQNMNIICGFEEGEGLL
jgi:N-acetyl-gamma-glutamyl-phosphate reductase